MHQNLFLTAFSPVGSNPNAGEASLSRLNPLYEPTSLLGQVSKPKMVWHMLERVPVGQAVKMCLINKRGFLGAVCCSEGGVVRGEGGG